MRINIPNEIINIIMSYANKPINEKLKNEIINYKYNKFINEQLEICNKMRVSISYETYIRMKIRASLLNYCYL